MLLWNIKLFRNTVPLDDLIKIIESRDWPILDQDILNFICNKKMYALPYKYNLMQQNYNLLSQELSANYTESLKDPFIIHFKPFKHWYFTKYSEHFWKFASHSPFFDSIIDKMVMEK
jgi:lipopolysaccharide biosynthesis glycosyltransferase